MVRVPVVGIIDTVQVAGKIEVHSLLSGATQVVDPESQGFQTMTIVGELILIGGFVLWQGINWVLIQALSNGSLTYDLFWGVVICTVYWSVDRYGNIGDQPIWVYSTTQTYLYGVTIEPNGNILYH